MFSSNSLPSDYLTANCELATGFRLLTGKLSDWTRRIHQILNR